MTNNLVTILGPTASGKTKLAVFLAYKFGGEIISADSRQVYKGMDIGTGKDLSEYIINNITIPVHLIDIISPGEEFNLFLFKEYFINAFKNITEKKKLPFLVGGSALYLNSILKDYNLKKDTSNDYDIKKLNALSLDELKKILINLKPSLHNTTDLTDKNRIIKAILIAKTDGNVLELPGNINHIVIGISFPKPELKERIKYRLKKRLEDGMIEEVRRLHQEGISYDKLNFFGLEYRYVALYLQNKLNFNDMFQKLNSAINNFAKRQMTWYRKMEREGIKINWINGLDYNAAENLINKNLSYE